MWIFSFQAIAYFGKVIIHPEPLATYSEFLSRMAVGPFPGAAIFVVGALFHGAWVTLAIWTYGVDKRAHAAKAGVGGMG